MTLRRRSGAMGEAGMTLVEILVAVSILSIAVAAIVTGLASSSMASDRHRKQVNADAVVRSYGEVIKERSRLGYQSCGTASTYAFPSASPTPFIPSSAWSVPTGYSVSVSSVQYWHADADTTTPGNQPGFTSSCGTGEGAQLLTLSASSADNRDTETLQIIVRAP